MRTTAAGALALPVWLALCAPSWAALAKGANAAATPALPAAAAATAAGDLTTPLALPADIGQTASGLGQAEVIQTVPAERAPVTPAAAQDVDLHSPVQPARADLAVGHDDLAGHHVAPPSPRVPGTEEDPIARPAQAHKVEEGEGAREKNEPPILAGLVQTGDALGHLGSRSGADPIPALGQLDHAFSGAAGDAPTPEAVTAALRTLAARTQPVVDTVFGFDPSNPTDFTVCGPACIGSARHLQESLREMFPGADLEVQTIRGTWGEPGNYVDHAILQVVERQGPLLSQPIAYFDPTAAQKPALLRKMGFPPGQPVVFPYDPRGNALEAYGFLRMERRAEQEYLRRFAPIFMAPTYRAHELDATLGPGRAP